MAGEIIPDLPIPFYTRKSTSGNEPTTAQALVPTWYGISWKGLKAEARGDYFIRHGTFESFDKASVFTTSRDAIFDFDQYRQYTMDGFLTYDKTFAVNHSLNVVAGISHLFQRINQAVHVLRVVLLT
jgi:hypothetical protein